MNKIAWTSALLLLPVVGAAVSNEAADLVHSGFVKCIKGDSDGAVADFDAALRLEPRSVEALYDRGNARLAKDDYVSAVADFTAALDAAAAGADVAPAVRLATIWMARAHAKFLERDFAGAISDYSRVLRDDPANAKAYSLRAALNSLNQDYTAALFDYAKVIALEPKSPYAYVGRGIVEEAQGDHDAAIADFDAAARLDAGSANVYMARADAKAAKGDRAGALADFDRAVALDPSSAYDFALRGRAKGAFGDYEGAVADYAKAIELDPTMPLAYSYRAAERYDREAWADSLRDYLTVCALTPDRQSYARLRIWLIRARTGDRHAADAELARYLDAKSSPGQEWLDDIGRFLLGRSSEARVLKAATAAGAEPTRAVAAYFFAGSKRLIEGDRRGGRELLKKCVETGRRNKQSYRSAVVEIDSLDRAYASRRAKP